MVRKRRKPWSTALNVGSNSSWFSPGRYTPPMRPTSNMLRCGAQRRIHGVLLVAAAASSSLENVSELEPASPPSAFLAFLAFLDFSPLAPPRLTDALPEASASGLVVAVPPEANNEDV